MFNRGTIKQLMRDRDELVERCEGLQKYKHAVQAIIRVADRDYYHNTVFYPFDFDLKRSESDSGPKQDTYNSDLVLDAIVEIANMRADGWASAIDNIFQESKKIEERLEKKRFLEANKRHSDATGDDAGESGGPNE